MEVGIPTSITVDEPNDCVLSIFLSFLLDTSILSVVMLVIPSPPTDTGTS